jgi:hypothetical protein
MGLDLNFNDYGDAICELLSNFDSSKYKSMTLNVNAPSKSLYRTKFGIKEFDKIEVYEDIMQGFTSLFFNRLFNRNPPATGIL